MMLLLYNVVIDVMCIVTMDLPLICCDTVKLNYKY